ncbi:MAG: hypothetical protein Tsb0033_15660 [Winogradskyella sp.]
MVFGLNANSENQILSQEKKTVTTVAIFDGYDEDEGYAFLVKGEDEYDDVMYFSDVTPEVLKTVNLKSEDKIGERFEITYEIEEFEEEDEYGYTEVYEKYTIIKIKKI